MLLSPLFAVIFFGGLEKLQATIGRDIAAAFAQRFHFRWIHWLKVAGDLEVLVKNSQRIDASRQSGLRRRRTSRDA